MKQILDAASVSWGVLARETCCGEPARRAGNEYLFMQLSEKVMESLANARVKKIVLCDPHCTTMLDKDYRQIPILRGTGHQGRAPYRTHRGTTSQPPHRPGNSVGDLP